MLTLTKQLFGVLAATLTVATTSSAQALRPDSPESNHTTVAVAPPASGEKANPAAMTLVQASPATPAPNLNVAPPTSASPTTGNPPLSPPATTSNSIIESGGVGVREFQGDDVGQVLRLLARQAKINVVVSDAVTGTVTMRLEDVTALQAIAIIVKAKGLFMDQIDNVYYIKTGAERTAEPTESDSFQFSYSRAKDVAPLLATQLASKEPPQIDERTNTIFFRETRSNIDNTRKMLLQIDKPTKQVMIEARLDEVNANPKQSYGINWAGAVGGSTNPQTFKYGASNPATVNSDGTTTPPQAVFDQDTGTLKPRDWFLNALPGGGLNALGGQFAILSVPQMSVTLRLLNEDTDAEFLANPRVVTADNQTAAIEITRNQPVPQLNFNEQTATAVFGGFQDKVFGNKLVVRPSVNKDNFITLSVKPEISNKVSDATFVFAGAAVSSPIID